MDKGTREPSLCPGILVEDKNGNWWHFYWGADDSVSGFLVYIGCASSSNVGPNTWCYKYLGDPKSLEQINAAKQYSSDYDSLLYLEGDFSDCIHEMRNIKGKYNLFTNNCSQVSLGILAKAQTEHASKLKAAANEILPGRAFAKLSGKGMIERMVERMVERMKE